MNNVYDGYDKWAQPSDRFSPSYTAAVTCFVSFQCLTNFVSLLRFCDVVARIAVLSFCIAICLCVVGVIWVALGVIGSVFRCR